MNSKLEPEMVLTMVNSYHRVISLVMKVDVLFQVILILSIAMLLVLMLHFLSGKEQQDICHVSKTYKIEIQETGLLLDVLFQL